MKTHKLLLVSFISIIGIFLTFTGFKALTFTEPTFSLDDYQIEEGFDLSIIASETLLMAPVSMDFDDQGRIWVVEMRGYMPNLEGIGEDEPTGKITILEDLDHDGVMDHAKTFMDGLVLPRAIAYVYGGILYSDGGELWFSEIKKNDKPGKKTLVDPLYASGGNVEHTSNGLMMNIDNWIYNANYNFRYRKIGNKWIKEPTSYRGQWGITKDNFGRLYYNNNSTKLQTDFVLSNKAIRNEFYKPSNAESNKIADNNIYPIHATSVNRGYQKGVLDERGFVKEVTASCGPVIYRGGHFPKVYDQNAFICAPEGNLITREVLSFDGLTVNAETAIPKKSFIASTDEGFRPVNMFNGPDGAMYIVDMHRGIIQHKAYISQYLTDQLAAKQLDTLQHAGRILKVVNNSQALHKFINVSVLKKKELVQQLTHPNGWVRDRVQQRIIQKNYKSLKEELTQMALGNNENYSAIHALYTLDGLGQLDLALLSQLIKTSDNTEVVAHALLLTEQFANASNVAIFKELADKVFTQKQIFTDTYLALALNSWSKVDQNLLAYLSKIEARYLDNKVVQDAITSSLMNSEEAYLEKYASSEVQKRNLNIAIKSREKNERNSIFVNLANETDNRTRGLQLFRTICASCHGLDGAGIPDLAPPLKDSEYINGSVNRLAAIILHGLSGPVTVNGQRYVLNNEMPGLANNPDISDQDVAEIIAYLQNAFAKDFRFISASSVKQMRESPPKGGIFDEKQLLEGDFGK